jgi:soluble lytic murein transglycosylase
MNKQIIVFLSMILLSSITPAGAPVLRIDEVMAPARLQQAKEIFGRKSSATSLVTTTFEKENLAQFLVAQLDKELPEAYKVQSEEIAGTILSTSSLYALDPLLILAIIRQESHYRPDAMGRHGEIGLMQIKPETARWIASRVGIEWLDDSTLFDPQLNIRIGAAYISFLRGRFENRGKHYLAAYNLGPAALRNRLRNNDLPVEYSTSLTNHYARLYKNWLNFDAQLIADLN